MKRISLIIALLYCSINALSASVVDFHAEWGMRIKVVWWYNLHELIDGVEQDDCGTMMNGGEATLSYSPGDYTSRSVEDEMSAYTGGKYYVWRLDWYTEVLENSWESFEEVLSTTPLTEWTPRRDQFHTWEWIFQTRQVSKWIKRGMRYMGEERDVEYSVEYDEETQWVNGTLP